LEESLDPSVIPCSSTSQPELQSFPAYIYEGSFSMSDLSAISTKNLPNIKMENRKEPIDSSSYAMTTVYRSYDSILRSVRSYATNAGVVEILPSPVAPQMEFVAEKTLFLGSVESPVLVLPASQTFQKEVAALAVGPVYCVAACYRRELSTELRSGRHLNTFFQIEFELPDTSLPDVCEFARLLLSAILQDFPSDLLRPPQHIFDEIDVMDLANIKDPIGYDNYDEWAKVISGRLRRPTWVFHTPQTPEPRLNRSLPGSHLSTGFDLLLPDGYGEILSGGLRDYDQLRRFWDGKSIPTGNSVGFGIGLERLTAYFMGETDLRRLQPLHFSEAKLDRPL
jgi:asparaginyl-tRNA synthetase